MAKTIVKVTYRTYSPLGWIVSEDCNVEFTGANAQKYADEWLKIKQNRRNKYAPIYEENEKRIKELRMQANRILLTEKHKNSLWRIRCTPEEQKAKQIKAQALKLEIENKKNLQKMNFSAYEMKQRLERLLFEKGFHIMHSSSEGGGCTTYTDIWVKD